MRHYYIIFFAFLFLFGCSKKELIPLEANIIPMPLEQTIEDGVFVLDDNVSFTYDEKFTDVATYFNEFLKNEVGIIVSSNQEKKEISFSVDSKIENEEGYELAIDSDRITIQAKTSKGAFYAVQSLMQLFLVDTKNEKSIALQALTIKDQPQFKYRGMHLDVGRHFFSVDFIKKYIDQISRLKMNTFHWHLTEDQGWRIEIKKYPKLQEIAAYRKETLIGHYSDQPHQFDGKKYGGFYTQEQIKEIVAYAQTRQVTIIPEIEMPGHSQAAIAAYPELGCASTGLSADKAGSATHKKIEVATKWGVFEEVYCPKESTFQFLEDVIDEVVDLFPGKYIHIGGDEAPKTRWKNCAHCQKLIKKEGLKDEHGLQSYFISRMEKYINSKGKKIIGWDEILEGGLAPNATVMSWRGTNGAVEAAKEGHDVILTPGSHCYFDHYQSDNESEPLAIGGFLPLEKVYHFNPIPKELTQEESKYVLGAQGNVWTEYMPNEKKVEYMAFPRVVALSEVVWSSPKNKDYDDFIRRLEQYQKRLDLLDVNYANHIYEVKGALKNTEGKLRYELSTTSKTYPIYYSVNNQKINQLYSQPIAVDTTMIIKAEVRNSENEILGNTFEQKINLHKGVGAKITIDKEPHPAYNAGGKQALINGISGNNKRYGDKEWLGFSGEDIEIMIEFEEPIDVHSISTRFHNGNGQWIYAPKEITTELMIGNKTVGEKKWTLRRKPNSIEHSNSLIVNFFEDFTEEKIKENGYIVKAIKLYIPNYGVIPEGKQGAGHKAWTFIDEIIIE